MLSVPKCRRAIQGDDEANDALDAAQQDLRYALFRLSTCHCSSSTELSLTQARLRIELAHRAVSDLLAYLRRCRAEEEKSQKKQAASRR